MSRYIDADALLEDVRKNSASYFADDFAREWVDRQPTADVRENVYGEWIKMTVSSGRSSWKCSVCGRRARGKLENLPFCHCGARMRGENNGMD